MELMTVSQYVPSDGRIFNECVPVCGIRACPLSRSPPQIPDGEPGIKSTPRGEEPSTVRKFVR
jgi:hypothetical protein